MEEAVAALQKAVVLSARGPRQVAALGHAYAVAGKKKEAAKLLNELKRRFGKEEKDVSAYDMAVVHAGLGEKNQAFAWLEMAYENRDGALPFLHVDPRLASLHSHPRFRTLLRRMNFPE